MTVVNFDQKKRREKNYLWQTMPPMTICATPEKKRYDDTSNDTVYSVFFFWFLVLAFGDLKINLSY